MKNAVAMQFARELVSAVAPSNKRGISVRFAVLLRRRKTELTKTGNLRAQQQLLSLSPRRIASQPRYVPGDVTRARDSSKTG